MTTGERRPHPQFAARLGTPTPDPFRGAPR